MFALRQMFKYACSNAQKPFLISKNLLSYNEHAKSLGGNTTFCVTRGLIGPANTNFISSRLRALDLSSTSQVNQQRNVTQYSYTKGKRRTVKPVLNRFYRLDWGIWIRTICGRHKKLYKKSSARKRRLQHHVFCNAQQSNLLDKMVNKFYKRPKYFVDDPYEPYHKREEFVWTRKQPLEK